MRLYQILRWDNFFFRYLIRRLIGRVNHIWVAVVLVIAELWIFRGGFLGLLVLQLRLLLLVYLLTKFLVHWIVLHCWSSLFLALLRSLRAIAVWIVIFRVFLLNILTGLLLYFRLELLRCILYKRFFITIGVAVWVTVGIFVVRLWLLLFLFIYGAILRHFQVVDIQLTLCLCRFLHIKRCRIRLSQWTLQHLRLYFCLRLN